MINLRLPVIVCAKIRSVCLCRSAEITEAISLALQSVSYALENFSGFTGFVSTPNGQDETLALLHLHLYSGNYDYLLRNHIFVTNLKTYTA